MITCSLSELDDSEIILIQSFSEGFIQLIQTGNFNLWIFFNNLEELVQ